MLSKKHKYSHSASSKLAFKTQSPLCLLLNGLKQLKPQLELLLQAPVLNNCDLDKIIQILEYFPKTFQRNIHLINEASVFEHLGEIIKNLLVAKKQRKFKPYHLFTNWKIGEEIILRRIREGAQHNLLQLTENPQNFMVYNFIREIKLITVVIEKWANMKTNTKNVTYLCPETLSPSKKVSPTARQTAVSSACISRDNSNHQKTYLESLKDLQYKKKSLERSSTAKPKRQKFKLAKRRPSANQFLAQCFKKPILKTQKALKRITTKLIEFDTKKGSQNSTLNNFKGSNGVQENQEFSIIDCIPKKTEKISILDKSFYDAQENQAPGQVLNNKQEIHTSLKFINNENNHENDEDLQQISNRAAISQLNQEIEPKQVINTQQREKTVHFSKQREDSSAVTSQPKLTSTQSMRKLSKHEIKFKKGKTQYKRIRISGKISFKSIGSVINQNQQTPIENQPSHFTKRRKVLFSQKEISEIMKIVDESKKEAQGKKIKFEENVLLALADAIQIHKAPLRKQQIQKTQNQFAFQYRYCQLNKFRKSNQFNLELNHISAFFQQQQQIKKSEDQLLKEKIKALTKAQNFTNIFEISSCIKNNKDIIYNQIQRRFSFLSDQQWIKHVFDLKSTLQQKSL